LLASMRYRPAEGGQVTFAKPTEPSKGFAHQCGFGGQVWTLGYFVSGMAGYAEPALNARRRLMGRAHPHCPQGSAGGIARRVRKAL
jgi:hypothetical protein